MNILFTVAYVPSLVRVRSLNLIRFLSERGHRVSVLTLYTSEDEYEDAKRLATVCHEVHAIPLTHIRSLWNSALALPSSTPLQVQYSWQPALAKKLQELLVNGDAGHMPFDIIHAEHLRTVRYALHARELTFENGNLVPPIIWDSVDCISMLFKDAVIESKSHTARAITRLELGRTKKFEASLADKFSQILFTSNRDRDSYLSLLKSRNVSSSEISVLPNGVDYKYFQPAPGITREPATIMVHGKMSYHANVAMVKYLAEDIMPLVWEEAPGVRLIIVGKDPVKEIQALGNNSHIQVIGPVDDMRPLLQRATLSAAPLTYGAGIQNKVLEAMACATPVVSSPIAVSSLNAVNGRDLLVGADPSEFAQHILYLLRNPEYRTSLGENGRRFVKKNHDWNQIASDLETIYQRVVNHSLSELPT
jgi:polysaccharide biosynthesis protein PslH